MNLIVKIIPGNSILKVGIQKIRFPLLCCVTPIGKSQPNTHICQTMSSNRSNIRKRDNRGCVYTPHGIVHVRKDSGSEEMTEAKITGV